MPTRFSIATIIILAAVVWGLALRFFGVELSWDYAKPFAVTLFVVTSALALFDWVLWRWIPFRYFHGVPDISGEWIVTLQSSYVQPNTNQPSAAISGKATVAQTFSTLSIRIHTDTSNSFLHAERIIRHGDGVCEVYGVYQSDPSIHLRGTVSEIHYGAFRYQLIGDPPTEMNGQYWTDRKTSGSLIFRRKPSGS